MPLYWSVHVKIHSESVWELMPLSPAHWVKVQVYYSVLDVSWVYIESSRPARDTWWDSVSKQQQQQQKTTFLWRCSWKQILFDPGRGLRSEGHWLLLCILIIQASQITSCWNFMVSVALFWPLKATVILASKHKVKVGDWKMNVYKLSLWHISVNRYIPDFQNIQKAKQGYTNGKGENMHKS